MAQWRARSGPDFEPEPPGLTVLSNARMFPGAVVSRTAKTHRGGQLLLAEEGGLVPASWCRMDGRFTLPEDVDRHAAVRPLAGDHYFLGSMHAHFGHAVLEGLSRVWAFADFAARHPEGRALVYEPTLPEFGWELLARAGVPRDRVLTLSEPVRVERLHVPDPAQRTHRWLTPQMTAVWQAVGETVDDGGPAEARTWLSRRGNSHRNLTSEAEIEAIFAAAGFDIVRPETLGLADQLRVARRSAVLAGCVGSQMYLAAFQRPGGQALVMAPSNFFYADDALIARGLGRRLSVAFGSPIAYHEPASTWLIDAGAAHALIASLA